jgi:hypothetical protein
MVTNMHEYGEEPWEGYYMCSGWYVSVGVNDGLYPNRSTRYDVATLDDVREEHKPYVAMLWAAVSDQPFDDGGRTSGIEGIGKVIEYDDKGPLFLLNKECWHGVEETGENS